MSTKVRALTYDRALVRDHAHIEVTESKSLVLPAPRISLLLLSGIVLLSALSVVYLKDYNRRLFVEYQTLQKSYITLQNESGKLLLEQGLAAPRTFVQEVAERDLDMQIPVAKSVIMVKA
jgi:cell division protein FtsL